MAYAILRVAKIKSHSSATSKTQHNYRTQDTPNADPDQFSRNQELINLEQRNYWDLANERIAELGLKRLRTDAVRAMEVLLTASPEAFAREANGRAKDMRGSKWVQDNLDFLQQRFGAKNVVSFTLHQDEVTPHIHAVVVPITDQPRLVQGKPVPGPPERLSARDVFSPAKLRQLQTDYAKLMSPYGLERGVLYSTAIHQDVRRHYGAQNTSKQELAQLAAPLNHKPFKLAEKQMGDWLSPQAYLQREQARMNEYLAQQIATVNAKLAEVATVATANTLEHERAKVLEQRLATSHREHEQTKAELKQQQEGNKTVASHLTRMIGYLERVTVQIAQGEQPSEGFVGFGQQVRERVRKQMEEAATEILRKPIRGDELELGLRDKGFPMSYIPGKGMYLTCQKTGVCFHQDEVRPNGKDMYDQMIEAHKRTERQDKQQQLSRSRDNGIEM